MKSKQLHGIVHVRDGKVNLLKNFSDMNAAVVDNENLIDVLAALSKAGWKLGGDYELHVYKDQETNRD